MHEHLGGVVIQPFDDLEDTWSLELVRWSPAMRLVKNHQVVRCQPSASSCLNMVSGLCRWAMTPSLSAMAPAGRPLHRRPPPAPQAWNLLRTSCNSSNRGVSSTGHPAWESPWTSSRTRSLLPASSCKRCVSQQPVSRHRNCWLCLLCIHH